MLSDAGEVVVGLRVKATGMLRIERKVAHLIYALCVLPTARRGGVKGWELE